METDQQLLEHYAGARSEQAFRELVRRHINLVHSAALRESRGDASMAEDITQAVFTELARHAARLTHHTALAGWLYTCVRRMTANLRRSEDRRRRRELEALTMNQLLGPDPANDLWHQLRPVLDDVMHELPDKDRTAVVLRFFEGRNHKEVGLALGLTENAARMRVERSLERLRSLLLRRGVNSTASTLAATLSTGAALTAPSTLASSVATGALTSATAAGPIAVALPNLMSLTRSKIAAGGAVLALAATVIVSRHMQHRNADGDGQYGACCHCG
jgi:RNA polymerase sigma factor (sigma-70 family)